MKWFLLFVVANLMDAGITHYMLASNYPVNEANPIVLKIMEELGWAGIWVYKIVAICILALIIFTVFCKSKRDNIMKWASIVMFSLVGYMIGLCFFYHELTE